MVRVSGRLDGGWSACGSRPLSAREYRVRLVHDERLVLPGALRDALLSVVPGFPHLTIQPCPTTGWSWPFEAIAGNREADVVWLGDFSDPRFVPPSGHNCVSIRLPEEGPPFPSATVDDHQIGECAADRLAALPIRGLFAVELQVGDERSARGHGMASRCRSHYPEVLTGIIRPRPRRDPVNDVIEQLLALARPLAVFAADYPTTACLFSELDRRGLCDPAELALMGVCHLPMVLPRSHRRVASVQMDWRQWAQALLLLCWDIASGSAPRQAAPIPPLGVFDGDTLPRPSRSRVDRELDRAHEWLRGNYHQHDAWTRFLDTSRVSRRRLEIRFREVLGKSPNQFLTELRLMRAVELLQGSHLQVKEVAARCGFTSTHTLRRRLWQSEGCNPRRLRDAWRAP